MEMPDAFLYRLTDEYERRREDMNLKQFIDVTLGAGCKLSKMDFPWDYSIEYEGHVIAFAKWNKTDSFVHVSFRDRYLKWYQTIFGWAYRYVVDMDDYREKLARVINQNKLN